LPQPLREKLSACTAALERHGRVVVAFSGGVDSTLLLALAVRALGEDNVVAAVGVSPSMPRRERQAAVRIAGKLGARVAEIETGEFDDPRYLANPKDRCFYCKHDLLSRLKELAEREGGAALVTGANADDTGDFRPGLAAGRKLGVASPLLEAGVTKEEVRAASRALGLETWDKPAMACLSSRIPYGSEITPQRLTRIEEAEYVLHDLGFGVCRVRDHGPVARIEVPPERFDELLAVRRQIVDALKRLGFVYVSLDLHGFRSGSMNEPLGDAAPRAARGKTDAE